MTQEEKAKAYEEALETARKINSGEGVPAPPDWTICEVIFPELKEDEGDSEDERIRKAILYFIKRCPDTRKLTTKEYSKWVEYLEKQKVITEGDFGRGYDCGYQAGYDVAVNEMKPKVATAVLDSEKQKPAEDWREKRKKECPFRIADGCKQYAGVISECTGACSWVVDYPKLKEIQDKKEQEQTDVDLEKEVR